MRFFIHKYNGGASLIRRFPLHLHKGIWLLFVFLAAAATPAFAQIPAGPVTSSSSDATQSSTNSSPAAPQARARALIKVAFPESWNPE